MRKFKVIAPMTFRGGQFALTEEQYRRRRYVVRKVAEGIYEPITEISFKIGEVITTDVEVTRILEQKLTPLEIEQPVGDVGDGPASAEVAESTTASPESEEEADGDEATAQAEPDQTGEASAMPDVDLSQPTETKPERRGRGGRR